MVMHKSLSAAMNARIIGSGKETIVLAHGYGGDHSVWDKVLSSLAQSFQVLVFDWSFSGAIKDPNLFDAFKYSSYDAFADDLIALLEEMNLKSCVFVGHSMSGMIGCVACVKRPDLFRRLIMVSSSPRFINSEDYEGGFEMSDIEQLFKSMESNYDQWASEFASIAIERSDRPSVESFAKSLQRMGAEVALPLAKTVFLSDQRAILEQLTTPCTIIHTNKDIVVPDSVPIYMHNTIPGETTVEIIDTDGHFPQLTAHDQFLQVVYGEGEIAYQVGETTEILSRGRLCATPHCVRAPKGDEASGVERSTFALFMQPDWDEKLKFPAVAHIHQELIPSNGSLTFGEYTEKLLDKYYHLKM